MNISSVFRNSSTYSVQSPDTQQLDASVSDSSSSAVSADATQVQLSKPAELVKQLSSLQQSDPAKFKQVVDQISESFADAAQNASGEDATRLNDLSDKFAQAAESGDMSALRPPRRDAAAAQSGTDNVQGSSQGYAPRHAGGHSHRAPSQAVQDAFSSAMSIVKNVSASAP